MIFDTHAHYDDKQFDQDREELLASMKDNGIGTIVDVNVYMDRRSSDTISDDVWSSRRSSK